MTAFITGAAGQDGYYLIRELETQGHSVHALYRGQDEVRFGSLRDEHPNVVWHRGDVTDAASVTSAIREAKPDMVFNMAALSFVGTSWQMPQLYMEVNCGGLINVLEAVRVHAPEAHVIQASSSEMYGNVWERKGLTETDQMLPVSPYGVSKLAAHRMCAVYRESYGMKVSAAISFNHESPRRPPAFVTRKISQAVARAASGLQTRITLGNLEASRDWGYAGDYVKAYILMAQQTQGDDYVIGTGGSFSVGDFLQVAQSHAGTELGVITDTDLMRPNELHVLLANPTKAREKLGWKPETRFTDLVHLMVDADMAALKVQVPA